MKIDFLKMIFKINFILSLFASFLWSQSILAACGATDITQVGTGTSYWNSTANWSPANIPNNSTENAIIQASGNPGYIWVYPNNYTVGCVDVQSGLLALWTNNLTITGDYFRSLNSSGVYYGQTTNRIIMAGTAAQTVEIVDRIPRIRITNNTSVTYKQPFSTLFAPEFNGTTSSTLNIEADYEVVNDSNFTIPAGHTVNIRNGAKATFNGDIIVNGSLNIDAGSTLSFGGPRILRVNAGGLLKLTGSPGNVASIEAGAGNTIDFRVFGSINAEYFRISRTNNNGVYIRTGGAIQKMENGEFHNIATNGYGIRLQDASVTIPATMYGLGFFNDDANTNTRNIRADAYSGSVTFIDNWDGDLGGEGSDNDPNCGGDPTGCITWGTQASVSLTLSNATAAGNPPATLGAPSADSLFATYAFALTQSAAATDITSVTFTQIGTASNAEVGALKVYRDSVAGDCTYSGADVQIGSDLYLSGSPAQATVSIPTSTITTNSATPVCLHLVSSVTALGSRNNTIQFEVSDTADVTNSTGYDFSLASGPPVSSDATLINAGFAAIWKGSGNWNTNANWFAPLPSATRDCQVGAGSGNTNMNVSGTCKNADLPAGGTIDFLGTTRSISVRGSLDVDAGYSFLNSASASFIMNGTGNQSIDIATAFPGNLSIANTGADGTDYVDVTGDSEISGNITISNGVLRVGNGVTLKLGGNLTVQNGGELEIAAGGTLEFANGSVLTVDNGGILTLVGNTSNNSIITSNATSSAYTVVINGTIAAQYYTFSRLGTNGVRINSGATIDATAHLQNGNYTYPVNNSSTLLSLYRQVPTNTMDNMSFALTGSSATGTTNIYTDSGAGAGTLTINNYSGDISGAGFDNDNTYLISWAGATTTIDITREASSPATVSAGSSVIMGRYGFQQAQAGASFSDTDITSLKITQTGSGSATNVDTVNLYYDADCNSAGGSLIGSGTLSGSPGSVTFSIGAGNATIEADVATPPLRCLYVEYEIAGSATDGETVGARITTSGDFVDDQSYGASGSLVFPLTLGSPSLIAGSSLTIWTGSTSTNWNTASNWTAGVPTSSINCEIPNAANNPVINGITAVCKDVEISNGTVTFTNGTGAGLEVYGSFTNTGTVTQNDGNIIIRDNGVLATEQRITSTSTTNSITFNKTAGGKVTLGGGSDNIINNLTFPGSSNFEFEVSAAKALQVANSFTVVNGVIFTIAGSGHLKMANGTTITNNGGIFRTTGINDIYPQATSNKATISNNGSGRWGFISNSGIVSLVGFIIDDLNVSGLRIAGTTNLSNLDGGQFVGLTQDFATPVRALVLSTSTTISEATASNVGFNWGAANATYSAPPSPAPTDNYFLVHATNCGSQTLTFDQWFGDFWGVSPQPVTEDKILDSDDGAHTCNIAMDVSASPVSITSITATAYDSNIDVSWTTVAETGHIGFNVYRSLSPNSGYVQINPTIIRNYQHSHLGAGNYIFRDAHAVNGIRYYYYIEDVAANGLTSFHGPVNTVADASFGAAPALGSPSGSESSNPDSTPPSSSPSDPGIIDLGHGVRILSQTQSALIIEVIPPTMTFTPSAWDGSYENVHMEGYNATSVSGEAQLTERILLIKVPDNFTTATLTNSVITESAASSHKIAPAAHWTENPTTHILEASYTPDATYYAQSSFEPQTYFTFQSSLEKIASETFLKVKLHPTAYKANTEEIKQATKITLEVGLDGNAWDWQAPSTQIGQSPSAVENVLRIKYNKTAMYEMSYDEIANKSLIGPFNNADTTLFRMYYKGQEIPIDITSSGNFSSGDSIRFFAPHELSLEDGLSEIVLSPQALQGEVTSALRITSEDADPSAYSNAPSDNTRKTVIAEQDNYYQEDIPLGGHVEHIYWVRLAELSGGGGGGTNSLTFNIDLEDLDVSSSENVNILVAVRGRGSLAQNPTHHFGVYLNGSGTAAIEKTFDQQGYSVQSVQIPASSFVSGTNSIKIENLAGYVPAGDADIFDIDKVSFNYPAFRVAHSGVAHISNSHLDQNIQIDNFTTSPTIYDVSLVNSVFKLSNFEFTLSGAGPHSHARFVAKNIANPSPTAPELTGTQFIAVESGAYESIHSLELGYGYSTALKSTIPAADLIIVGHSEPLGAAQKLITKRQQQGLRVVTADVKQIYAEFSHGRVSSDALREFLLYAHSAWARPAPKYVLFLGDATTDIRDRLGLGVHKNALPARLQSGQFHDYASDTWFVTGYDTDGADLIQPLMATGRLPSNDPGVISDYIEKMLAYEDGAKAPETSQLKKYLFISDNKQPLDGFVGRSSNLKSTALSEGPGFSSDEILVDSGNESQAKADTIAKFTEAPLLVSYFGHGAEDMWAQGNNYFNNADVDQLANEKLPIVMALNCVNANYNSYDASQITFGEKMVFNKDGGAIAFWGSTSLTPPEVQEKLAKGLFIELGRESLNTFRQQTIGDLALKASHRLSGTTGEADVIKSWTLFGDPSMPIPEDFFTKAEAPAPATGGGGGSGCSLSAKTNSPQKSSPWSLYLIEYLVLFGIPLLVSLFFRRRKEKA